MTIVTLGSLPLRGRRDHLLDGVMTLLFCDVYSQSANVGQIDQP